MIHHNDIQHKSCHSSVNHRKLSHWLTTTYINRTNALLLTNHQFERPERTYVQNTEDYNTKYLNVVAMLGDDQ